MNMYHIELTKPNGSNIKVNIPARDVDDLKSIVENHYAEYKLKSCVVGEDMEAMRKRLWGAK